MSKKVYVYMIRCADQTVYCGYTTDMARRWQEHVKRSPKCKFTRRLDKHPLRLAQCWAVDSKSHAMKIECWIKKQNKKRKEGLLQQPDQLDQWFCQERDLIVTIEPLSPTDFTMEE